MEQTYFTVIRRWLWLLLLTGLVTGISSYWVTGQERPVYEAKARLIIGPGVESPNPDLNALRAGGQLLQTYSELATTRPILQTVIDDLNLNISPGRLDDHIEVKSNKETQILSISVQADEPEQAMAIANVLADNLVHLSPSNPDSEQAQLREQMRNEANKIEQSLAAGEGAIEELQKKLQVNTEVATRRLLLDQIAQERSQLADAHRTLSLLYDSLQEASTNQVKIIEPAIMGQRVNPQMRLKVLIGALAGLILGLVFALVFEYLDSTIRTMDELEQVTGEPVLSIIARHKKLRGSGSERLVTRAYPNSRAAENYRMLGIKLLSNYKGTKTIYRILAKNQETADINELPSGNNYPLRSILVSSTQASEDAREVAMNLAVGLAQAGHRISLVDAYLQQPAIGPIFNLADGCSVTGVLTGQYETLEYARVEWAPGLSVLPGGSVPPNPFELLASTRMADLIEEMESQADLVIIAASPLPSFADSLILASRVDGVLIVAHSGQTRRDGVSDAVASLRTLGAHVVGTVLNYNRGQSSVLSRREVKRMSITTKPASSLTTSTLTNAS